MEKNSIKFEIIKKLSTFRSRFKELGKISKVDTISPPSVFVGSKLKYPSVNVGIISPLERDENAWVYDAEKYWAEENYGISDVVRLRDSLLNSRFRANVKDVRTSGKFVNIAQEIAIASKPVDVEIELKKGVDFSRKKDRITTPSSLGASLKNARVVGNVKVDLHLDRMINDEVKASEGIEMLYKKGFDEYPLNKILSVGVLGLKKNKRFVPTRWSITATDDTIGKSILNRVRDYKWIEDYEMFYGEFLGNQYVIMLFPNVWSYELFELYFPGSSWNPSQELKASTDYENYYGRKNYASATAGGYYATRLPILKYLDSVKRQASVLVIRLETPSYWASLGVWVVRESVKKSIANGVLKFGSKEELISSAKQISKIKYGFDNSDIFARSKLMENLNKQTNLTSWF
jgi:DNA repair protein NreA